MVNKENAKQQIKELLEKYDKVVEEDRFSKYTEEETKKDFILPLFETLGWNIRDSSEVSAEESISGKRVDYGFRINGIPKFFLEAKPMKADLNKPEYAEQAINYAWHKGCTWAVLTDFDEGVKIYNAEWKTADLHQAHFMTIPREELLSRFDDLWLLSKESFEKGAIDKVAEKYGKKVKKTPVGEQLFSDLTTWRAKLSKSILERNKGKNLTETDLDESVQRIIDRLIFIRNCEDGGLEPRKLQQALREWDSRRKGSLHDCISDVFKYFDAQYDSKLFQPHLCDQLEVTNQVLEEIIKGLYRTKDRTIYYDFSALDADVLGNVYEQYLGHILKKTAKRAEVTERHAKRKEQGIYYTPTYIVDYIVRNTLGKLLEDKNVDVEKIRVLDPACGSGSFLIKAFDVLYDHHTRTNKWQEQTKLDLATGLPFTKKAKILHDNIFGVDLDTQAVEIAQLNLLLKIAEKGQRLPMLQRNIKCGNSLIDNEKVAGDKAFRWGEEFKQIMGEGGFDVVFGNPPYVFSRNFILDKCKKHFLKIYETFEYQSDLYIMFLEKMIKLVKPNGFVGIIVPNAWFGNLRTKKIRKFVLEHTTISKVVYCPKETFNIGVETGILILQKTKYRPSKGEIGVYKYDKKSKLIKTGTVLQTSLIGDKDYKLNFRFTKTISNIVEKTEQDSKKLIDLCDITRGVNAYDKYRGQPEDVIKNRKYHADHKVDDSFIPELKGKSVHWYSYSWDGKSWIKYGKWLAAPRDPKYFRDERLVLRQIPAKRLVATTIKEDFCIDQTVFIAKPKKSSPALNYLLGIINSSLMSYYFKYRHEELDEVFPKVKLQQFKNFPIKKGTSNQQNKITKLVDKMLSLNKRLNEIGDKKTDERARIEEEIKKTDTEINELVYKLYDITDAEKKIIEESLK